MNLKGLKNFVKGEFTRNDYFSVLKGFETGLDDKDFFTQLEKQWDEIDVSDASEFRKDSSWSIIRSRLKTQPENVKSSIKLYVYLRNIAAVLFIPLLLLSGVLYFQSNQKVNSNSWAEIICPAGVRTEFHLPDGTTGFLNSKSKLRYPVEFSKTRNVYLEGEAYFDVVKQNNQKFRVNTPSVIVEVLGTSFNVSAYTDSRDEVITLQTGKVNILEKNEEILTSMNPNQQFTLHKNENEFEMNDVKVFNYTSWITGKMIIDNESFEEVAKKLSRWYDVEIEVEGQDLKEFKYYATFISEPLDEVLRLISITAPIQYQEVARKGNPDRSFSKRKIKFSLDENRMKNFN